MEALTFFFSAPLAPFTAAVAAALLLLTVEIILASVAGSGFVDMLDALVSPDSLPDSSFTNWLLVRDMPLMMSLGAFICGFGLTGLALQGLAMSMRGAPLSVGVAAIAAVVGGVLSIRLVGSVLTKLKFTNTTAIGPEEFLGKLATLTATASAGNAGTAKFVDQHGYSHLVMVEPEAGGVTFDEGDIVVLERRVSLSVFHARKA